MHIKQTDTQRETNKQTNIDSQKEREHSELKCNANPQFSQFHKRPALIEYKQSLYNSATSMQ